MSGQHYAHRDLDASLLNAGCSSCQPGTHSPTHPPYSDPTPPLSQEPPPYCLTALQPWVLPVQLLPFLLVSPPGSATVVDSGATRGQASPGETFGRTLYLSAIHSPTPSGFWWMINPQAEFRKNPGVSGIFQ